MKIFIRIIRKIPNSFYRIFSILYRVTKYFSKSNGAIAANSLTFTFALAFIPFVVSLTVLVYLMPLSRPMVDGIEYFYLNKFIPQSGEDIYRLFRLSFIHSAGLSIFGLGSLIVSCYALMFALESHINMIFAKRRSRPFWHSIILFSLIIAINIVFVYYLGYFVLYLYKVFPVLLQSHFMSMSLAHIDTFISFLLIYKFIPYKKVKLKNALWCALFATISFAVMQGYFIFSVNRLKNEYTLLYGSLAILPIFLLWMYSEVLILLYFVAMLFVLEDKPHWHHIKRKAKVKKVNIEQ